MGFGVLVFDWSMMLYRAFEGNFNGKWKLSIEG
jgi:hypothetical protein